MNRVGVLAALVASAGVFAQAPNPAVTPFPLQVVRPANLSEKELKDLQATLRVLVRRNGAAVPDSAKLSQALSELKRADCDRDNECLAQLARLSGSLYGLFAGLDSTVEGDVVAWGRVVRDDGKAIAELSKERQVRVKRGTQPFADVAEQVLMKLLSELKLSELPPTKPVAAEVKPGEFVPPPFPPPEVEDKPTAMSTYAGAGCAMFGLVAVLGGSVLLGVGSSNASGALDPATGYVLQSRTGAFASGRAMQTVGVVVVSVGAAMAVGGAALWLLSGNRDDGSPKVTMMFGPGGAAVGITGELP